MATAPSPPMRDLVRLTIVPSDNFLAEMLLKDLGAEFGGAGTTAAGVGVVKQQLSELGVTPQIVDGSGLSRSDRTTPRQVVTCSRPCRPGGRGRLRGLPRGGRAHRHDPKRMRDTAAQDRCQAKTGTLIGVSALAGLCGSAGGHAIAFAVLTTRTSLTRAHGVQDRVAAAIAR